MDEIAKRAEIGPGTLYRHFPTRDELLAAVWGYDMDPGSNVVGVCVRRLRAKLGDQFITTVRGEGYQLGAG